MTSILKSMSFFLRIYIYVFFLAFIFLNYKIIVSKAYKEILDEKKKTKYWLFIQLGLSYQNFNRIINNETSGIKFDNLKALCDILECTPNDLFDEYHSKP